MWVACHGADVAVLHALPAPTTTSSPLTSSQPYRRPLGAAKGSRTVTTATGVGRRGWGLAHHRLSATGPGLVSFQEFALCRAPEDAEVAGRRATSLDLRFVRDSELN
eukprot:RCo009230